MSSSGSGKTAYLYRVQAGAYLVKANAEKRKAQVEEAIRKRRKAGKLKEDISVALVKEGLLWKVQCGSFGVEANAKARLRQIQECGFKNAAILKVAVPAGATGTSGTSGPSGTSGKSAAVPHRIRIAALAFFDTGDESSQYGDCTALIEYGDDDKAVEHAVLIDTAMNKSSANVIRKLKGLGVKKLDAIVISHAHGDHYGGATAMIKEFGVKDIYVADPGEVDKHQKSYGNALRSQYKKAAGHYVKAGTEFSVGSMKFKCIYQCPASSLKEHDSHHFINNESVVLRVDLNGWTYHTAGDLQNEGNNLLVKAVKNLKADVMKCQWHGDANACNETICKAVKPKVAFSNYHHKEGSGRGTTRKRLEAVGAVVARNHENGDIYIDCLPGTMKLSCSKGNLSKKFTKAVPAAAGTPSGSGTASSSSGNTSVPTGNTANTGNASVSTGNTANAGNTDTASPIALELKAYRVSLTTKVKPETVKAGELIAIEPEDYTKAEVAALKAKGATLLGYISIGSVSDERSYYKTLKDYTLDPLPDWPHEKYLDVRKTAVRDWLVTRAGEIKAQGFDGWWADNVDVYEEYKSSAMYTAIGAVLQSIKSLGGYVMVNGGMEYLQKAMDADGGHAGIPDVGGVTQEEVFSIITDYGDGRKDKGKFGVQESGQSSEYQSHLKRVIRHKRQAFLLEYTDDNTVKLRIRAFCTAAGAMACVSDDVNL